LLRTKIAGEHDGRRGSPALAEKDNAGAGLLIRGKGAVAIGIEQANDEVVRLFSTAIFEYPDVGAGRYRFANALGHLNGAVVLIIGANETAYESDDDGGGRIGFGGGCPGSAGEGRSNCEDC